MKNALRIVLLLVLCLALLPLAYAHAEETEIPEGTEVPGYVWVNGQLQEDGHQYGEVVNDDFLVNPEEPSNCVTPAVYWKSCINVNPYSGECCGVTAQADWEQAMERLQTEISQRQANGEQADFEAIFVNGIAELDAAYKFTAEPKGHTWVEVEYQPATCEQPGWETYHRCADCGETSGYIELPPTGHRFEGDYVVVTEPTCTEDGLAQRVCVVCGMTEDEVIPAMGHRFEGGSAVVIAPTCTEDGLAEIVCVVCGTTEDEAIPAFGHNFVDGICTVCGESSSVSSGTCGAEGDNLTWTLYDSGELVIEGTGEMANYNQDTIPWFKNRLSITSVRIENAVSSVGEHAFSNCSSINAITIPSSVTAIGSYAFSGCSSMETITVPSSVTDIGSYAFSGCSGLIEIDIPDSVTTIGSSVFSNCSSLKNISIPSSITKLSGSLFSGCTALENVSIPSTVTSIGNYAFRYCGSLKSVEIPTSVESIGYEAFYQSGLESITIPYSVTDLGSWVFENCNKLTSAVIMANITNLSEYTFYGCQQLQSVVIPSSVTIVGGSAFYGCNALSDVYYGGTEAEWQAVLIRDYNTPLYNATIHYNTEMDGMCSVQLNANNGTSETRTQMVPEGASISFDASTFTRDGYVFIGWGTAPEGPLEYADGAPITVEQDMTLYAQWAEALTITFDGNGGNYNWMDEPSQIVPRGIPTALKSNIFTRSNYTFKGWGLSAGDRSVDYEDQGIITLNEDITLYAIWEEIERIGYFSLRGDPYVGGVLTASVNTTSPKTYQWNRDGQPIPGATQNSYVVTPDDFLHRITCTVSIPTDTRTSDYVTINVSVEQEIIDDGDTSLPYGAPGVIRGVFPGMRYTVNGGAEIAVPDSIQNSRLEVVEPGTYVFRYNNLGSAPISVDAWYSIGYTTKSNSGSGDVYLLYGNTNLSSGVEIREDGKTIIRQYYGKNVPGYCWLVRKDAAPERFKLTVSPFANCYAHVSVNGGEISSYNEQTVIDIGILTAPVLCEITFTSSPLTPSIVVPIDEANFPDPVFRSLVSGRYDRDGDGMLSDIEINNVWDLSISNYSISSLRGVENFTELRSLYCSSNNLTELDLSGCAALNTLNCNANALTSLNLSGCTGLRSLNCANNSLRELDVSGCPLLETLNCSTNMLPGLDLSSNSALMSLSCSDNYFTSLNLAGTTALTSLTCDGNVLKRLDLTLNPSLVSVICNNNLLTGLDVSECPNLRTLRCGGNLLPWLDMSGCPSIMTLDCSGNSIETLILDGCTALTNLNCSNNRLQALALDSAASLNSLSCSANRLTVLDVSGLDNLTVLNCQSNQIAVIDVSDCGTLRSLNCTNNLLRQLDVTGCYSMKTLQCERNLLTALDLSGCEVLKTLYCSNNGLTQLDITDCTALVELVESTDPQERGTTLVYGAYGSSSSSSSSVPSYSLCLSIDQNVVLIYPHSIASDPDLILPSFLTTIEDEAFAGGAFKYVMLPEGVKTIGWHAFVDCPNLLYIYIPEDIESIDAHAFDGADRLTIIGVPGSSAESYAQLHGFAFKAAE